MVGAGLAPGRARGGAGPGATRSRPAAPPPRQLARSESGRQALAPLSGCPGPRLRVCGQRIRVDGWRVGTAVTSGRPPGADGSGEDQRQGQRGPLLSLLVHGRSLQPPAREPGPAGAQVRGAGAARGRSCGRGPEGEGGAEGSAALGRRGGPPPFGGPERRDRATPNRGGRGDVTRDDGRAAAELPEPSAGGQVFPAHSPPRAVLGPGPVSGFCAERPSPLQNGKIRLASGPRAADRCLPKPRSASPGRRPTFPAARARAAALPPGRGVPAVGVSPPGRGVHGGQRAEGSPGGEGRAEVSEDVTLEQGPGSGAQRLPPVRRSCCLP